MLSSFEPELSFRLLESLDQMLFRILRFCSFPTRPLSELIISSSCAKESEEGHNIPD